MCAGFQAACRGVGDAIRERRRGGGAAAGIIREEAAKINRFLHGAGSGRGAVRCCRIFGGGALFGHGADAPVLYGKVQQVPRGGDEQFLAVRYQGVELGAV